ncbi:MAG: glycosyltransferase family 2 protein, partial [Calditrichaeota bacterium]|nr:glycosyltransferase family 2 protein [Calditrichota bacterium]
MKIIALMSVYNEELYLRRCLSHLREQGIAVYLIDNGSTDRTREIAETFLGNGVIGIETLPR